MSILASEALLCEKIQWQNVTANGNRTRASHSLWFQVQHYLLHTNLTFACKSETLGSLYSHALLIPLKSSKSRYQVVHEQKFKDLSSTCQVSVESECEMIQWLRRSSALSVIQHYKQKGLSGENADLVDRHVCLIHTIHNWTTFNHSSRVDKISIWGGKSLWHDGTNDWTGLRHVMKLALVSWRQTSGSCPALIWRESLSQLICIEIDAS